MKISREESYSDYLRGLDMENPLERTIAAAMMDSLSKSRAACLQEDYSMDVLLKLFCDKKSKKVVYARNELRRRFRMQSTDDRKRILTAFLSSSKTDREWAAQNYKGTESLELFNAIVAVFEHYGGMQSARAIIKYHPDWHYIKAHREQLEVAGMPVALMTRLCEEPGIVPDENHWSVPDYFAILAYSGKCISEDNAKKIVRGYLYEAAKTSRDSREHQTGFLRFSKDETRQTPCLTDLGEVKRLIWHLSKLCLVETLDFCRDIDRKATSRLRDDFKDSPGNKANKWEMYCEEVLNGKSGNQ